MQKVKLKKNVGITWALKSLSCISKALKKAYPIFHISRYTILVTYPIQVSAHMELIPSRGYE